VAVVRALRNTQVPLDQPFYVGGVLTNADGAVTVTITRADGTVFATDAATTNPSTGVYRYTLAPQANLEYFTLVWTGTFGGVAQKLTSYAEIAGAFYVSIADIRGMRGLASTTDFPNLDLEEARRWFEDMAEDYCQRAFVPRYGRDRLDGDNTDTILLDRIEPRTILSAKIAGVAQTGTATWALYNTGRVVRDTGTFAEGSRNVEITYEYGADEPDSELREAALRAIQYRLLGDNLGLPAEAMSAAVDVRGPINLGNTSPGFGITRPTGIPEVDHVLTTRGMAVWVG
jgi:hypothetical protein